MKNTVRECSQFIQNKEQNVNYSVLYRNYLFDTRRVIKQQTTNVLKLFDGNHLIANPEKFHLMFLLPNKIDQAMNEQLLINNTTLDSEPSITLLGMEIDNSLTFNTHIGNLCKKAASQLNVLKRFSRFMGYNERRIIMQSFILSNF